MASTMRIFCHSLLVVATLAAAGSSFISIPAFAKVTMDSSTATAARLYGEIARSYDMKTKPNFIFSPFSIFSVFHSAQKGASGDTKAQMDLLVDPDESFLLPKLQQPSDKRKGLVTVDVANRLYMHSALDENKQFKKFMEDLGEEKASAEVVNFANSTAAASRINNFVANVTHNHITHLIDASDLGVDTRLVLINALYFKAPWLEQFKKDDTAKDKFQTPSGIKEVPFMDGKLTKSPMLITLKKEVTAVALPYADPRLRLYVFMPPDLTVFESKIVDDPNILEDIVTDMELTRTERAYEEEIHLRMPKFKLAAKENKIDLAELFKALGVENMFDSSKADFRGITGDKDLFVSSFVHQADIDVNEDGTEATAGTAMMMMLRMMVAPKKLIHVVIDKPFMFQLRYVHGESNYILFNGRVADPTAAQ